MEPPDTKSRNQRAEIPDERRASIGLRDWPRGMPHLGIEEEKKEI